MAQFEMRVPCDHIDVSLCIEFLILAWNDYVLRLCSIPRCILCIEYLNMSLNCYPFLLIECLGFGFTY